MTEIQFAAISDWQKKTFGHATALSKLAHLKDELKELEHDLLKFEGNEQAYNCRLELADCFILLFGIAASSGMPYSGIIDAIEEKMKINYARKWGPVQANGVVNHIRDEEKL